MQIICFALALALSGLPFGYSGVEYTPSLPAAVQAKQYTVANMQHSAALLNRYVLLPGGVLSFADVTGPYTEANGYGPGGALAGDRFVLVPGGGACNTATALYRAAKQAGLQIIEQHHHAKAPPLSPSGEDAAIFVLSTDSGEQKIVGDLKIRNSYPWPVRIKAYGTGDGVAVMVLPAAMEHRKAG